MEFYGIIESQLGCNNFGQVKLKVSFNVNCQPYGSTTLVVLNIDDKANRENSHYLLLLIGSVLL